MAKVKEPFVTKADRTKIIQIFNYINALCSDKKVENNYILFYKNSIIGIDRSFIVRLKSNDFLNININDTFLIDTENKEMKEKIPNECNNIEEVFKYLDTIKINDTEVLSSYINDYNKYDEMKANFNEIVYELNIDKNDLKFIIDIMEDKKDGFHSFPILYLKDNKIDLIFQTETITFKESVNNDKDKEIKIYFPYDLIKQIKKMTRMNIKITSSNELNRNCVILDYDVNGFDFETFYFTIKERK